MDVKDFETAQENTRIARDKINAGRKAELIEDKQVGIDLSDPSLDLSLDHVGIRLFERTVKTEILHASQMGYHCIVKKWRIMNSFEKNLTQAGFTVKREKNTVLISWWDK